MATKPREPWPFDDATLAVERMVHEYADRLLRELPHLDEDTPRPESLVASYRWLTDLMVQAVRRYHRSTDLGAMSVLEVFSEDTLAIRQARRKEAEAAKTAWDVMHRHLVALHLMALLETDQPGGPLELVLQAEQAVEELAVDIDGYRA
jgi:hypothetical protein